MEKTSLSSIRQKLLLIDASPDVFEIVSSTLASEFDVLWEKDLSHSMSVAESEHPDFIFLGLEATPGAGHEVLARLHSNAALSVIPVIALTPDSSEESQRLAIRHGASAILTKPLRASTLREELRDILAKLNVEIRSSDGSRYVQVSYSSMEKIKQMHDHIQREVTLGRRVIVLSPTVGRQFVPRFADVNEWVSEGKVIYLEIKPLLAAKMEYMEDLTAILRDLERIIELGPNEALIVDEPETLLLPNDQPNPARIHAFERSIARVFETAHYFCKRPAGPARRHAIGVMARSLAGAA